MISVIVPVYNTAAYLERCLESLSHQTYEDIEIIIVDDGSTDSSGAICDAWVARCSKMRVIHQENGGLSAARNRGIEAANGSYLLFVDGDDYVMPNFAKSLYEGAVKDNCDICICNYRFVDEKGNTIEHNNYTQYERSDTFDGIEGLTLFENRSYRTFFDIVCNKIFKRELFNDIKFPEGVSLVEDIAVMPSLYHMAQRISVISDKLYNYVYRENSISNSVISEQKDLRIRIPMMEERLRRYREWGIKEISLVHIIHLYSMYRRFEGNNKIRLKELRKEFRNIYFKDKYSRKVSGSRKIKFAVAALSLDLYDRLVDLR